jgi:thiamine pyrophosphokinase
MPNGEALLPSFLLNLLDNRCDALLISGGVPPRKALLKILCKRADMLIAVDGGVNVFHRFNMIPQHVIGDLDSAAPTALAWARRHDARIHAKPRQDEPDIVKALDLCLTLKRRHVLVCGAGGERTDHVLVALQSGIFSGLSVTFLTNDVVIFPLRGHASRSLHIPAGHAISWLGFPGARGCTIAGVRWPFRNRSVRMSGFHSLSNAPTSDLVQVAQVSGSSLLMISLRPQIR